MAKVERLAFRRNAPLDDRGVERAWRRA